jgi:hypothetical protein
MATQKDTTLALINTNIVSAKTPKISPADHREVSLAIVDCIDNRFIRAGTQQLQRNRNPDQKFTITFDQINTPFYTVVWGISTPTIGISWANCANNVTIKDKGTSSFDVLMRSYDWLTPADTSLTFEYALFRIAEPT